MKAKKIPMPSVKGVPAKVPAGGKKFGGGKAVAPKTPMPPMGGMKPKKMKGC